VVSGRAYYAEIVVREYGEPDRTRTLGPFSGPCDDAHLDPRDVEAVLADNLARQDDEVLRVWHVDV
jgi:hypothetical protein